MNAQENTTQISPTKQIEEIRFTANGHTRQLAVERSPQQLPPEHFIRIQSAAA